jgi:hypothetical protein
MPLFGAFIWSLLLEPIFGAYFWSLFLEPPALARVVPSWLGALLSGAFLKIRCGVVLVVAGT